MTTDVTVVVPYQGRVDLTGPLVERLLADPATTRLLLADNGSSDRPTLNWQAGLASDARVVLLTYPRVGVPDGGGRPHSLYRSWNAAIVEARHRGGVAVVLNNDLDVPDRFVSRLVEPLVAAPDRVASTYPWCAPAPQQRGLTVTASKWPAGWTPFAFAGRDLPTIDERFVFYCGDVELLWKIRASGRRCGRVNNLRITHRLGATRKQGRWAAQIAADRRLRQALYPHGPASSGLVQGG